MMAEGMILVADDDNSIRTVIGHALGREGYEVRSTSNAATLWRWVSEGEGDLVITDVIMPDEDGLDLLSRINKIRPELPVIVMSARNTMLMAILAKITKNSTLQKTRFFVIAIVLRIPGAKKRGLRRGQKCE